MHRELHPGERYRDFDILEVLGSGSFARVYKVLAPGFDRPLALKLAIMPRMSDDTIKRAVREISILRTLTNPHVVRLHGSSVGRDHFYLLMDLLEGTQLDGHHHFDEPMAPAKAVDTILQACMGLAEAHAQGVVHRDLKPANLWIEPDGTVKVLDFGLARAWGVPWAFGANATAGRTLVGTPHYCQPEQLHTDRLTPASDVYSLATILYELLSGHAVLFEDRKVSEVVALLRDNPVGWLDAHAMRQMVPIHRYRACADLPDRLIDLLSFALAKDPALRPANAEVMANALGEILHADLGASPSARVIVGCGSDEIENLALIPGRRWFGTSPTCDLRVEMADVPDRAVLFDWSGFPRRAQIRPLEKHVELHRDGVRITAPVEVRPSDVFTLGPLTLQVVYPGIC